MIHTTNKSVKDWPKLLAGDEVLDTAIRDRLLRKEVEPSHTPGPSSLADQRDWSASTTGLQM